MTKIELRMSYDFFLNSILAIKHFSDELNDGWELVGNLENKYNVYLKKKIMKIFDVTPSSDSAVQNYSDSEVFENSAKLIINYEYHIVYSISYGVPVLYLNIWDKDGKRLSMEEAWKHFDKKYVQENMYTVLTEQDHPVLQTPFLTLHPCKTSEILDTVLLRSKNPVISWLSSIAPAVSLGLNNEYEHLT